MSEGMSYRIKKGNRAHYEYKGLMTSKLINKYSKRTIYMPLIRPVVTYVCKTWTLSVQDLNNLLVFEM